MARQAQIDHLGLAAELRPLDARSGPRPIGAVAAEHGGGDGGGAGGVGDAHFTDAEQIDARLHAHHAVGHGARGFLFAQRRPLREILGRLVQAHLIDAQIRIRVLAQLVDGGTAALEVQHHLLGDLLRIGGDAEIGHTVIAGEDGDARMIDLWGMLGLPAGEPGGDLLQPRQGAGRLGQLPLALGRQGYAEARSGPGNSARRRRNSAKPAADCVSNIWLPRLFGNVFLSERAFFG